MKKQLSLICRVLALMLIVTLAMPSYTADAKSKKKKTPTTENEMVPYNVESGVGDIVSENGNVIGSYRYNDTFYNVIVNTTISFKKLNSDFKTWEAYLPNGYGSMYCANRVYSNKDTFLLSAADEQYMFTARTKDNIPYSYIFNVRKKIFSRDFHTEEGLSFSVYDGIWPKLNVKVVKFTSSNSSRLTISEDGTITAIKGGKKKVTISALCDNGKTYKCKVKIDKRPKKTLTVYEPDANHWGLIHQNEKKYEWIPEMTYDYSKRNDIEEFIINAVRHGTVKIEFINVDKEGREELLAYLKESPKMTSICTNQVENNHFSLFYLYGYGAVIGYKYTLKNYSMETMIDMINNGVGSFYDVNMTELYKVEEMTQDIVQNAILYSHTEEETIRYIFDYLYDHSEYNSAIVDDDSDTVPSHYNFDARGVLLYNKGVCSSYADAYALCLTMLGFQNYICSNVGGGHVWNKLLLDNEWLNIDISTCISESREHIEQCNIEYVYRCDGDSRSRFLYLVSDEWLRSLPDNSFSAQQPCIYKEHPTM